MRVVTVILVMFGIMVFLLSGPAGNDVFHQPVMLICSSIFLAAGLLTWPMFRIYELIERLGKDSKQTRKNN